MTPTAHPWRAAPGDLPRRRAHSAPESPNLHRLALADEDAVGGAPCASLRSGAALTAPPTTARGTSRRSAGYLNSTFPRMGRPRRNHHSRSIGHAEGGGRPTAAGWRRAPEASCPGSPPAHFSLAAAISPLRSVRLLRVPRLLRLPFFFQDGASCATWVRSADDIYAPVPDSSSPMKA